MRVDDVADPVVAAATRTPFESRRRVFVLERADTLNDQAANRLLKTLEEPAAFVHLILVSDRLGEVLPTIASRCQLVRFDPLSSAALAARLEEQGVDAGTAAGVRATGARRRRACAVAGDRRRPGAARGGRGVRAGAAARGRGRAAVGRAAAPRPRAGGEGRGDGRGDAGRRARVDRQEGPQAHGDRLRRAGQARAAARVHRGARPPARARRALVPRPGRASRRARRSSCSTRTGSASCAPTPRAAAAPVLRSAIDAIEETRRSLELNVTEELACEALAYRLERMLTEG